MPDFLPLGVSGNPCQIVELPVGSKINPDHVLPAYGSAGQVLTVNDTTNGVLWAADSTTTDAKTLTVSATLGYQGPFAMVDPHALLPNDVPLSLVWSGAPGAKVWVAEKATWFRDENDTLVAQGESSPPAGISFNGATASGITGLLVSGNLKETHFSSLVVADIDIHGNAVVPSGIGATLHSDDPITCNADATIATHLVRWNQVSGNFTSSDHGTLQGLGDDDHSQYIFNAPATTNRNLITQTAASRPPFGIKKHATGSSDLLQILDSGSNEIVQVDKDANLTVSGTILGATVSGTTVSGTAIEGQTVYAPSVSGVTVSGTTIEGQTVYAPSVSGTTVSGTAIEGQTVYAPSVSGVTVSGTTVKGINGSFTGDVSAASGVNDGSLATMDMFGRMFTHTAYRSGSFTSAQTIFFFVNTTDQDANFVIPDGMTLKILAAYGRCKTGGTAGTTTWTLKIRAWTDEAHSGYTDYSLAAGSTTDTSTWLSFHAHGTMESPLASITNPVGECGLTHAGPGTSGSDKHTISVYGVFV